MHCYITDTGSFLPGEPISNNDISRYIGTLENEEETRAHILKMNGIQTRHYALDQNQSATHDLYDLGTIAAKDCLQHNAETISYLSAGSTNTPLIAPGISSILHDRLTKKNLLTNSLEINSNSGVCTASAQSLVNAIRTVKSGEHKHALCLGVEQPSAILKSSVINPPNDRASSADIRMTKWFMSVFLRSMLSDGAGAMLLGHKPKQQGTSFKVNWTYSRSFANEAPLCMKLESPSLLLSQNVSILSKYMKPFILSVFEEAFKQHEDDLSSYSHILPHLSSFLFNTSC